MGLQEEKDDVSAVSCGTTTSRADSAVEEVGRTLKLLFAESNTQMNLEAQALWAENMRLKAECEKAQRSKAILGSQLHAISQQSARDKEAELGASAAVALDFAAAQKRLEVDLIRAREEKKLMEQAFDPKRWINNISKIPGPRCSASNTSTQPCPCLLLLPLQPRCLRHIQLSHLHLQMI